MLQISLPPSEKSNALLLDAVMSLGGRTHKSGVKEGELGRSRTGQHGDSRQGAPRPGRSLARPLSASKPPGPGDRTIKNRQPHCTFRVSSHPVTVLATAEPKQIHSLHLARCVLLLNIQAAAFSPEPVHVLLRPLRNRRPPSFFASAKLRLDVT
jgi:hypothetical protein